MVDINLPLGVQEGQSFRPGGQTVDISHRFAIHFHLNLSGIIQSGTGIGAPDIDLVDLIAILIRHALEGKSKVSTGRHSRDISQSCIRIHHDFAQSSAAGQCTAVSVHTHTQLTVAVVAHGPNGPVPSQGHGMSFAHGDILDTAGTSFLTSDELTPAHLVPAILAISGGTPDIEGAILGQGHSVSILGRNLDHTIGIVADVLAFLYIGTHRNRLIGLTVQPLERDSGCAQNYIVSIGIVAQLAILIESPSIDLSIMGHVTVLILDLGLLKGQHEVVSHSDLCHAGQEAGGIILIPDLCRRINHSLSRVTATAQHIVGVVLTPGPYGSICTEGNGKVLAGDNLRCGGEPSGSIGRSNGDSLLISIGGPHIVESKTHGEPGTIENITVIARSCHQLHDHIGHHAGLHIAPVHIGCHHIACDSKAGDSLLVAGAEAQRSLLLAAEIGPSSLNQQIEGVDPLNNNIVHIDLEGLTSIAVHAQHEAVWRRIAPLHTGYTIAAALAYIHYVQAQSTSVFHTHNNLDRHHTIGKLIHIQTGTQLTLSVAAPGPNGTIRLDHHNGAVRHSQAIGVPIRHIVNTAHHNALPGKRSGIGTGKLTVIEDGAVVPAAPLIDYTITGHGSTEEAIRSHLSNDFPFDPVCRSANNHFLRQAVCRICQSGRQSSASVITKGIHPVSRSSLPFRHGLAVGRQGDNLIGQTTGSDFRDLVQIASNVPGVFTCIFQYPHGHTLSPRSLSSATAGNTAG